MKDQEYTKFGPLYINWYLLLVIQLQEPITLGISHGMEPTQNMETVEIISLCSYLTPRKLNKVVAAYIRVDYKIPTSWLFQKYWFYYMHSL